jgi:hypothetical protein
MDASTERAAGFIEPIPGSCSACQERKPGPLTHPLNPGLIRELSPRRSRVLALASVHHYVAPSAIPRVLAHRR